MIRVVHMVGILQKAGLETFLMDVYRNTDRSKVQYDFIVHGDDVYDYEHEIIAMGGRVHHIARKSEGLRKHCRDLYRVIKENDYKIIVRATENTTSAIDLIVAKKAGAKYLIAHSHNGSTTKKLSQITNKLFRPVLKLVSTERYACSREAGEWLFGKGDYEIIKNGRDLVKFSYNPEIRDAKRTELGLNDDELTVVSVARFYKQKNHHRIVSVFKKLKELNPKAKLILAGAGPLEDEIKALCQNEIADGSIKFLGVRDDVSELMQAADVFLMPSFYEGLPLTIVEAQATGLACFLSDAISQETKVSDCVQYLSLNDSDEKWAEEINKISEIIPMRRSRTEECRDAGFDIADIAKKWEEHFLELVGDNNDKKNNKEN